MPLPSPLPMTLPAGFAFAFVVVALLGGATPKEARASAFEAFVCVSRFAGADIDVETTTLSSRVDGASRVGEVGLSASRLQEPSRNSQPPARRTQRAGFHSHPGCDRAQKPGLQTASSPWATYSPGM